MGLKLARTAGFCFGVKNAVQSVKSLLNRGASVCTLGQLIHSPQVVKRFESFGVRVIDSVYELKKNETLVIRSHGVGPSTYEEIRKKGVKFKDATCPFVRRIHKKVFEECLNGSTILIAGNSCHPEVLGIVGYCFGNAFVFDCLDELKSIFLKHPSVKNSKLLLVAQTTFNKNIWQDCINFLKDFNLNIEIFCSICLATKKRQDEAMNFSKTCDVAVVIGGKNSSNSKKLFQICSANCKTFFIEKLEEIEKIDYYFKGKDIFLTAGASTPDFLIKAVYDKIYRLSK